MLRPSKSRRRRAFSSRLPAAVCGALIMVLAFVALPAPLAGPTIAVAIFAGVLLGAGLAGTVALLDLRTPGLAWRIAWVSLATLSGLAVLYHHWTGSGSLRGVVGAALVLFTPSVVALALHRRARGGRAWLWPSLGGVAALALVGLLIWAPPHLGLMLLGLFLAVNLAAFGVTLIASDLARDISAEAL